MLKILVGGRGKGEELKWEAMSVEELATLASTPALFGGARTFRLVGALADEGRGEEFLDMVEVFTKSPHTFVFEEGKLLKGPTTKLEKAGAKIEVEKKLESASARPSGFDPYGLTFALGSRDRKKLWLGLTQSLKAGDKPEAIAGLLAWKARQMKDANLSRQLVWMYHDSHRGAGDLKLLLERFALTL
ncbi:MAG: hypothetical protein KGH79_01740 [Patescibacteria group bacterium]|nr:hypothetical protein [Patescibacteria group bacterium]